MAFDAGAHQRLLGAQSRHRLTLHVRTHQRTVGVIVLQEWNQRCSDRHHLTWRHVHVGDLARLHDGEFVAVTYRNELIYKLVLTVDFRIRLCNHALGFLNGRQILNVIGDLTIRHLAVRRLKEAILVGAGIGCQRVDQTNVRTFRSLDRANSTIMGRVHVTDFEAGAFTGQTAWAKGRYTTLVRDFGQRVVLVHELAELGGTEKFLDRCSDRLGVDQILRHQPFGFGQTQTLLDGALDPDQADTELIFGHLADGTDATVTKVIDIVNDAVTVTDIYQRAQHVDDVRHAFADVLIILLSFLIGAQGEVTAVINDTGTFLFFTAKTAIELHTTHCRQIVALFGEEQVLEQVLRRFLGRRLARAHHPVDFDQRLELTAGRVGTQGVRHERTVIEIVGVQRLESSDPRFLKLDQNISGNFSVALKQHFAS